jgi:hypothetical protein
VVVFPAQSGPEALSSKKPDETVAQKETASESAAKLYDETNDAGGSATERWTAHTAIA